MRDAFRQGALPARLIRQHLLIDSGRVAIADHPVGKELPTVGGCRPGGAPACHGDLFDIHPQRNRHPGTFQQAMQLFDKPAGPAHAEKHPPAPLQIVDQRIDRGRGEGVAANKQRMDRKGLPQQRMADVAVHQPGHRAIAAKPQQRRHLRHHRGKTGKGPVGKLFKTDRKDPPRGFQKPGIAFHISWREPFNLAVGILDGGAIIELLAIMKMKPVPGVQRPEIEMILAGFAKQLEQLVKQEGGGDHCRAGVMAKAATFKHLGPSADCLQPVDKCDAVAARAHAQRCRDAAESGTDHQHVILGCGWGVGRGLRLGGQCHSCRFSLCSARLPTSDIPAGEAVV